MANRLADGLTTRSIQRNRCACGGRCPRCRNQALAQPKLAVGQVNDQYEMEADRIADQVIRMPGPALIESLNPPTRRVHNACAGCEEKETQRQVAEEGAAFARAERDGAATSVGIPYTNSFVGSLSSRGQHLPTNVRGFMEPRFGIDFGSVRVHTGVEADRSAKEIRAQAYTTGQHIVFRSGQYNPGNEAGLRLLAHELTHVVQQSGVDVVGSGNDASGLYFNNPGSVHEVKNRGSESLLQRDPDENAADQAENRGDRRQAHVFVYDKADPSDGRDRVLAPAWRAAAEAFAEQAGGFAVQAGANAAETAKHIADAFEKAHERFDCIVSVDFYGHGSAGEALSGDFKPADAESAQRLREAQEVKEGVGSFDVQSALATKLQLKTFKQFERLRKILCGDSIFHFRTCETLSGRRGEKFGGAYARYFGTHVMGYKEIVDVYAPGRRIFNPEGRETTELPEELRSAPQPIASLPFRTFTLILDLSRAKGVLGAVGGLVEGEEVRLIAIVEPHEEPGTHWLRFRFDPSQHSPIQLSKIVDLLLDIFLGEQESPAREKLERVDGEVRIPISRSILERFDLAHRSLSFSVETEKQGTVGVTLRGRGPLGHLEEHGGLDLSAAASALWTSRGWVLGGQLGLDIPLGSSFDWLRYTLGLKGLVASKHTYLGQGRFSADLNLGNLLDLRVAALLGGGTYRGQAVGAVGGGLSGSYVEGPFRVGGGIDIMGLFGEHAPPGPAVNFSLHMGFTFR